MTARSRPQPRRRRAAGRCAPPEATGHLLRPHPGRSSSSRRSAGCCTNSLALLSDAGHMLTDVIGLGMALAAIQLASRHARRDDDRPPHLRPVPPRDPGRVRQRPAAVRRGDLRARRGRPPAHRRAGSPRRPDAGRRHARTHRQPRRLRPAARGLEGELNVEGAYLEVLADTLGSVGVIIAAMLLEVFGWTWVDPVVGAAIGLWILPRTYRLGGQAVRILLQAAPPDTDLDALASRPRRHRRRGRRPRPPRLDADVRDGDRLGAPDGRRRRRQPTACSTRPATCSRAATASPTPPCRSSRPPTGLRRAQVVIDASPRARRRGGR